MAKRDRLAEIRRRWRRRVAWNDQATCDEPISFDEVTEIDDNSHRDIGYLLRRLAKAEMAKGE